VVSSFASYAWAYQAFMTPRLISVHVQRRWCRGGGCGTGVPLFWNILCRTQVALTTASTFFRLPWRAEAIIIDILCSTLIIYVVQESKLWFLFNSNQILFLPHDCLSPFTQWHLRCCQSPQTCTAFAEIFLCLNFADQLKVEPTGHVSSTCPAPVGSIR
jgi:hypothetical protein